MSLILFFSPFPHGEVYCFPVAAAASGGLIFLLVVEGIGDFLAAVEGADEDEEGPAGHDEAEGAGGRVAFVICGRGKTNQFSSA